MFRSSAGEFLEGPLPQMRLANNNRPAYAWPQPQSNPEHAVAKIAAKLEGLEVLLLNFICHFFTS